MLPFIGNITSANALHFIIIPSLYSGVPIPITGFEPDAMASQAESDVTANRLGADGFLASGWIPRENMLTITLSPASPSIVILSHLYRTMQLIRRPVKVDYNIVLTTETWSYTNGVLANTNYGVQLTQTKQPYTFTFQFADVKQLGIPDVVL